LPTLLRRAPRLLLVFFGPEKEFDFFSDGGGGVDFIDELDGGFVKLWRPLLSLL